MSNLLRSPLLPNETDGINATTMKKKKMYREEAMITIVALAIITVFTHYSFSQLFSVSVPEHQHQRHIFEAQEENSLQWGGDISNITEEERYDKPRGMADDTVAEVIEEVEGGEGGREKDADNKLLKDLENPDIPIDNLVPKNLGQKMRSWLAKKQLEEGFFFNPPDKNGGGRAKPYTANEVAQTIPHFTRELLLVQYIAASDEFTVQLPGDANRRPPVCDAGCVRIENIMRALLFAFRNRFAHRFQRCTNDNCDLMFLVSTADTPRLSRECYEHPGQCKRRQGFAPILHFGSSFRDRTILPTLVTMPPPPGVHLRCMDHWQQHHEMCEFLLPKRITEEGRETPGIVFGQQQDVKSASLRGSRVISNRQIGWDDLIPQVVWRGSDFPYLPLLHPNLRPLDVKRDIEVKVERFGKAPRVIVKALETVYNHLRPRWKALAITAGAEFDAQVMNGNPRRKNKVLPWANMKFTWPVSIDHKQSKKLGIPVLGEQLSIEELAQYKYHIDIAGGGGTALQERDSPGTLEKLALPGLLFHHAGGGMDWYHEHLVPMVHYVPIKEDLSDLRKQYEWAEKHERKAREIAKAASDFVRRMGRPEGLDELYHRHLLKPLDEILRSYQAVDEMPELLLGGGGVQFREVMRCSGYDIRKCRLITPREEEEKQEEELVNELAEKIKEQQEQEYLPPSPQY